MLHERKEEKQIHKFHIMLEGLIAAVKRSQLSHLIKVGVRHLGRPRAQWGDQVSYYRSKMNIYSNQRTSQSSVFAKRSSVLHRILTWGSWPGLSSSIHAKFLIAALFVAGNTSNWDFCSPSLHLGFLCFLFTFHQQQQALSVLQTLIFSLAPLNQTSQWKMPSVRVRNFGKLI